MSHDERSTPGDRPYSRDGAPLQAIVQGRQNGFGGTKNIRGQRMLTVGEHPQRRIRPQIPPAPLPDLIVNSVSFSFVPTSPTITYYYTPSDFKADPTRLPPPGGSDPAWSLDGTRAFPPVTGVLPPQPKTLVIPEFGFLDISHALINGSYTLTGLIELLGAAGQTLRSYELTAAVTGAADGTNVSYTNTEVPTFGTDGTIEQFYAVRLTWTVVASALFSDGLPVGPPDGLGYVTLTWFTAAPYQGVSGTGSHIVLNGLPLIWKTEHSTIDNTVANVITAGNADYRTGILWADPDRHDVKLPWHYAKPQKLRGRALFWLNWKSQSKSISAPNFVTLGKALTLVTVDAAGADVEELTTKHLLSEDSVSCGFLALTSQMQTQEANGFYFKWLTETGEETGSTQSNVIDLLTPLRVWWTTEDVP